MIAQHGHSSNDQLVYQLLWAQGVQEVTGRSRIVSIGVGKIARLAGTIHERNIPIILRRLIAKQSIEIVRREVSDQSEARHYRVFSYEEILERRRRLGMEWVTRSSRGVDFVDPSTGQPLQTASPAVLAAAAVTASDVATPPDDISGAGPPAVSSWKPPAVSSAPLENGREKSREPSSSVGLIVQALRDELGLADDEAARRIQRNCREKAADASEQEIAAFVRLESQRLRANRRVENPIGLLITQVPKHFEGESWRLHRETQHQGREAPPDDPAETERYRAIVEDPQASEPEKRIALAVLAGGRGY